MPDGPEQDHGCLGNLILLIFTGSTQPRRRSEQPAATSPFAAKDWLLSRAERSFLGVLDQALTTLPPEGRERPGGPGGPGGPGFPGGYRVFCKVRLLDVLYPRPRNGNDRTDLQAWRNRVDRKHLDFLIVAADTLRPLVAIELDDRSHGSAAAAARDAVKDEVLAAAGLPGLRFPARQSYPVDEVRSRIAEAIATRAGAGDPPARSAK